MAGAHKATLVAAANESASAAELAAATKAAGLTACGMTCAASSGDGSADGQIALVHHLIRGAPVSFSGGVAAMFTG